MPWRRQCNYLLETNIHCQLKFNVKKYGLFTQHGKDSSVYKMSHCIVLLSFEKQVKGTSSSYKCVSKVYNILGSPCQFMHINFQNA